MNKKNIVTSFLFKDGKVLLLKRSNKVGSFRGKWAGISGFIEDENSLEAALREIKEETAVDSKDLQLLKIGMPFEIEDKVNDTIWSINPFLFSFKGTKIIIDWEHDTFEWIYPNEIDKFDTVTNLKKTLFNLIENSDAEVND
ncbi:MAG: dihydroneopterin triphosphate pyrophosphatase [Candidatus Methanofastidiosum methylothiophilum]|jgi:8-oxo-dGTP pyrophosphatase MutT (NUDIX family)|uniref:Dihydroneopterin triphosphate pyrophosphatase n=1 Tax=Candidatus Methanofastidiosum methylothiophilum TaxID=1705564 RepID=A0A150INE1_9EURY|nr:MAG: dihydroneopterin triphosphate pyrophosphatase [Candidatus Methanofastidiosum methylthiophilus]NMC77267.1 NUDIX domain-containing protein [Candidatus Methanofastidiosa archaeon]